jgi:hypothetical protein
LRLAALPWIERACCRWETQRLAGWIRVGNPRAMAAGCVIRPSCRRRGQWCRNLSLSFRLWKVLKFTRPTSLQECYCIVIKRRIPVPSSRSFKHQPNGLRPRTPRDKLRDVARLPHAWCRGNGRDKSAHVGIGYTAVLYSTKLVQQKARLRSACDRRY